MNNANQIPKEFKMGLGESGSIDVTRCIADDGSRITMVVRNGHISINNTPVAVDEKGFVVSRVGSLLPIKYQDFYRQASAERANRMIAELAKMKDVPSEDEVYLQLTTRRTAWVPGPEIGFLSHFKFSQENKWLPKEMKHLVNRLSSKIDNLGSAVEVSMHTITPKPSEQPRRSLSATICNCIHSLRHRRTGSLLENEQDLSRDDNLDFVLRALHDAQLDVRDLERVSHQLSKRFRAMQNIIREAEQSNWALAKTVEASCTGALSSEKEEAYVMREYYDLVRAFVRYLRKGKESEEKFQELESTNQKLVERVQELEDQVQELSNNERLVERLQELADRVQEMSTVEPRQVDRPACPSSPESTREVVEASTSDESINDSQKGIICRYEEDPAASWFKAFKAHHQYWKGFHDLSDGQKQNQKVLHELKVECGAVNDQNKRLMSRLGISEINSAKLQDQLRNILKEKQNLQERLRTSQTLLRIAQKSLVSQPDGLKDGRENVNGQMASYGVGQSENRQA